GLGVDFVVVQGRVAGGHLVGEAPLMSLLPAVVDKAGSVPVVAAGGIADGRGLAAALALGACGVWVGTRFVASVESGNHPNYKAKITEAEFSDIVETTLFDGGWPDSPHRVIRNSTLTLWEQAGRPAPVLVRASVLVHPDGSPMLRYNVSAPWALMEADWEAGPHYAGASAALVHKIEPIATILSR